MVLVDSNVLIDVISQDSAWCEWSLGQLRLARAREKLTINAMVVAEIAVAYDSVEELEGFLKPTGILVSALSTQADFIASRAFMRYRKTKGTKTGVLPDFSLAPMPKRKAGICCRATQQDTAAISRRSP